MYKTTSTTTPEPPPIRIRNPGRRTRPGQRRRPARPFRPVYYDDFDDDYFQDYDEVPLYEDEEEAPAKANDADAEVILNELSKVVRYTQSMKSPSIAICSSVCNES